MIQRMVRILRTILPVKLLERCVECAPYWMPLFSRGMTWVGGGAILYDPDHGRSSHQSGASPAAGSGRK